MRRKRRHKHSARSRHGPAAGSHSMPAYAPMSGSMHHHHSQTAMVALSIRCTHLLDRDLRSKSDPVCVVSLLDPRKQKFVRIGQTECQRDTLNPIFRTPVQLPFIFHQDQTLQFDIYDIDDFSHFNRSGGKIDPARNDFLGRLVISLATIIGSPGQTVAKKLDEPKATGARVRSRIRSLFRPKKGVRSHGRGRIIIQGNVVGAGGAGGAGGYGHGQHPGGTDVQFLDFVGGGMEIELLCAVDFTSSNGRPDDPSSLHYFGGTLGRGRGRGGANPYERAISTVGQVLQPYDHDGYIPAVGFGAIPPNCSSASHCFPLNLNSSDANCLGMEGVMQAYHHSLQHAQLSGPTYFSEVINWAAGLARSVRTGQRNQKYFILMLMTDGRCDDIAETVDAIVEASSLPLSIVIVGVGQADFSSMRMLDADDRALVSRRTGRQSVRDIVQFVPFEAVARQGQHRIAAEVLEEIPGQIVGYCSGHGIVPESRPQVDVDAMAYGTLPTSSGGMAWRDYYARRRRNKVVYAGLATFAAAAIAAAAWYWKKSQD